jgi:hypothetical protein
MMGRVQHLLLQQLAQDALVAAVTILSVWATLEAAVCPTAVQTVAACGNAWRCTSMYLQPAFSV